MAGYAPNMQDQSEQEQFGSWLRTERERLQLTRAAVARLSDVSEQQLYRIETGETGSKRETLRAIARAMKLSEADVLERAGFSARFLGEEAPEPFSDEDIDLPAYEAFLLGLPRQMQRAEYERIRQLWLDHRRGQTDYGKLSDE